MFQNYKIKNGVKSLKVTVKKSSIILLNIVFNYMSQNKGLL